MTATTQHLQLDISGMTCASCAARIEKRLNRMDGVTATVNYATERASVDLPTSLDPQLLVTTVEKAGYGASLPSPESAPSTMEPDPSRRRLLICAALTLPVVLLSMIPAGQFTYWQWASLLLAAPVAIWGAWPFHRAAWTNLRHGSTTMDTLVSLGVTAAFGWSLYALFLGSAGMPGMHHSFDLTPRRGDASGNLYLEVAAGVTTFLLLGRHLESSATRSAGSALQALLAVGAREVTILRDDAPVTSPISALKVGDRFLVRPGETIAADGLVESGHSSVDTAMLTGESVPQEVGPQDHVTGGTLSVSGSLVVQATSVGEDTQLAQMARLVEQAQTGKAQVQRLADRVSTVFVPVVLLAAAATGTFWLLTGAGVATALTTAIAVLIVACPCALGLATPTALMVGTGRGAQLGILIKGPQVLESTRRIDTVVLDKTGTLTTGVMTLQQVIPDADATEVLTRAAAVEALSEHPIARAITAAVAAPLPAVTDFTSHTGFGVSGTVQGTQVVVGRPSLLTEHGLHLPENLRTEAAQQESLGRTVVTVGWDGEARGLLAIADDVRPTAAQAVRDLKELGLRPVLLTGDNQAVASQVAAKLDIPEVIAGVLPHQKAGQVKAQQVQGKVVAMVGDGINDAPALAQADLGISMGTGTDAAIEASDLTLMQGDPARIGTAIRLARRTHTTIRSNLFWAFAYNVAAIPLAAAGLLNPMLAGAAMAVSSVFVVTNSLRLRRFTG